MSEQPPGHVTTLLQAVHAGRPGAKDDLMHLIYTELRQLAAGHVRRSASPSSPQPTVLVHEAYLRLFGKTETRWEDRHHFFWAASRAMHDILVEQARRQASLKRGGRHRRAEFPEDLALQQQSEQMIELSEALNRLGEDAPEAAAVVMLRFFAGLTHPETAEVLGVSEPTVRRRWMYARAWLHKELSAAPMSLLRTQ